MTYYIDANVFIFAILDAEEIGDRCRSLLTKIKNNAFEAATSSLTFDEIAWSVKKHKGSDASLYAGEYFLKMPNLLLLPATKGTMIEASKIIKEYSLDPRDAIHAATCLLNNISVMISDDPDFDSLTFLKRKPI